MNRLWESFTGYESVQDMPAPRELPIALAHCMVKAHPGSPRMELLNRIFNTLDMAYAIQCRAELRRCRAAIAFPQPAVVL